MRLLSSLFLISVLPFCTFGADNPPVDKLPVAIVDLQQVVFDCPAGKKASDELQAFVKSQEDAITAKRAAGKKLEAELLDKEKSLTAEQRLETTKKLAALRLEAETILDEAQKQISKIDANVIGQIQKEADRLVREYAKERGIQLVLDASKADGKQPGLHAIAVHPEADITKEILKRMVDFKIKPLDGSEAAAKQVPSSEACGETTAVADEAKPQVVLETSMGDIVLELDQAKAPITVANFLKYVDAKHYDGVIFHRVIKTFMIQGGGFTEKMEEKPTLPPIKNEAKNGLSNARGTIAMARTPEPDSASAQFFINVVDNKRLDHQNEQMYGYAVFGKVVKGMDVVDKIREVATGNVGMHANVPTTPIVIKAAKRVKM